MTLPSLICIRGPKVLNIRAILTGTLFLNTKLDQYLFEMFRKSERRVLLFDIRDQVHIPPNSNEMVIMN